METDPMSTFPAQHASSQSGRQQAPASKSTRSLLDHAVAASVIATGGLALFVFAQQLHAGTLLAAAGTATGISVA